MLIKYLPSIMRRTQYRRCKKKRLECGGLIAVFAHPNDLNCPTQFGQIADKLDPWLKTLLGPTEDFAALLHPFRGPFREETAFGYLRTERLLAACFLRVLMTGVFRYRRGRWSKDQVWEETWSLFFNRVNAKIVIGIGLGSRLICGAHIRGIKCIEVQHGLLGSVTIDEYWPKSRHTHVSRVCPDLVMTWDNHYQSNLELSGVSAVTSGHAHLAYKLGTGGSEMGTLDHSSGQLRGKRQSDGRRTDGLLVLLSWGQQTSHGVFDPVFDSVLGQFAGFLDPTRLVFRLHPVIAAQESKTVKVRRMLHDRFPGSSVHSPRDYSFMRSSVECTALLSRPTAAVFDAALLGMKSFVVGSFAPDEIPDSLSVYITQLVDENVTTLQHLINTQACSRLMPYDPDGESLDGLRERIRQLQE